MVQLLQQSDVSISNDTILYSEEDNFIWYNLYTSQIEVLKDRVYEPFLELLNELCLPKDRVPQLYEVSNVLRNKTGWTIAKVNDLIPYNDFFNLLANKVFPSTTYIRTLSVFSKDPDIFHELFGHCPMLLNSNYSLFLSKIAKFALQCPRLEQIILQRFLWYTIEVGLIQTSQGLRIYGGALISSPQESIYSLESSEPERKIFDLLDISRSPYRADVLQTTYYFISSFEELYNFEFSLEKLSIIIKAAKQLGEYPAKFKIEDNKYTNANIFLSQQDI